MVKTKEGETEGFGLDKLFVWIRGVEGKLNILRREFDVLRGNETKKYDKLNKECKIINEELLELKREIEKIKENLNLIIKELKLTAGKEEILTLKKYVDLWNPLTFVTQRDVERIIEEKIKEKTK